MFSENIAPSKKKKKIELKVMWMIFKFIQDSYHVLKA